MAQLEEIRLGVEGLLVQDSPHARVSVVSLSAA